MIWQAVSISSSADVWRSAPGLRPTDPKNVRVRNEWVTSALLRFPKTKDALLSLAYAALGISGLTLVGRKSVSRGYW